MARASALSVAVYSSVEAKGQRGDLEEAERRRRAKPANFKVKGPARAVNAARHHYSRLRFRLLHLFQTSSATKSILPAETERMKAGAEEGGESATCAGGNEDEGDDVRGW